jgi:mRNA interferase MazF
VRRGDVVLVALAGDYGKPRPAVIVQSDLLNSEAPSSYIVCPLTTTLTGQFEIRVPVEPSSTNGLRARSEIMIEKVSAASVQRLRDVIGRLDASTIRSVDRALLLVLGIA